MALLLHILTRPNDSLAEDIVSRQRKDPANKIEVIDLTDEQTDYKILLEKIFTAESVQVW
jgi:hypothetical protein